MKAIVLVLGLALGRALPDHDSDLEPLLTLPPPVALLPAHSHMPWYIMWKSINVNFAELGHSPFSATGIAVSPVKAHISA
jgi:hypothetical protein